MFHKSKKVNSPKNRNLSTFYPPKNRNLSTFYPPKWIRLYECIISQSSDFELHFTIIQTHFHN